MKILYLGPERPEMIAYLESRGDNIVATDTRLSVASSQLDGVDLIVSYGYRHIIKDSILQRFPRKIINLHISLLPFNRGADPNLWSFLENSPRGGTIHYMDAGIDTGDIIAQREIFFDLSRTLRDTYDDLDRSISGLFQQVWPEIRSGAVSADLQPPGGSYHRARDKQPFLQLLTRGWDTPTIDIVGRARQPSQIECIMLGADPDERQAIGGLTGGQWQWVDAVDQLSLDNLRCERPRYIISLEGESQFPTDIAREFECVTIAVVSGGLTALRIVPDDNRAAVLSTSSNPGVAVNQKPTPSVVADLVASLVKEQPHPTGAMIPLCEIACRSLA